MRARRLPVIDEYVEDDQVVVFVDGRVVALSPLATAALFSVGVAWTDVTAVSAELVARFGEPPGDSDPMEVTHTTLESLAGLQLVEL